MKIFKSNNMKEEFNVTKLRRSLRKRGFSHRAAKAVEDTVLFKIEAVKGSEISHAKFSKLLGEAILEPITEAPYSKNLGEFRNYFSWSELLPTIKSHRVDPIPNVATLVAPSGKYVGDHISASRHIVVALWSQMNTFGELTSGIPEMRRIQVKNAAYAAAVHFARAETAVADASIWRIKSSRRHNDRHIARDFLREKREALKDASKQIQNAISELKSIIPTQKEGGGENNEADKSGNAAADAINQAELILESMLRLIRLLGGDTPDDDDEELDALTDAVTGLAEALGGGARAAVVGAIGNVIEAVADSASATPEDIDVNVDPQSGEVTIYFRIEYSCLFLFDFLMDDDFVWIRKNARDGGFTFATGESAVNHHRLQQNNTE